jgi:hypothetical protein
VVLELCGGERMVVDGDLVEQPVETGGRVVSPRAERRCRERGTRLTPTCPPPGLDETSAKGGQLQKILEDLAGRAYPPPDQRAN